MATNSTGRTRLFFIDYLRAAIITLVILHHVATIMAAMMAASESTTDLLAVLVLVLFMLFNQSWFMGLFFLLAGYFTPASFDRKGAKLFLKGRLTRLGIPLLIVTFVLNPLPFFIGGPLSATLLAPAGTPLPLMWQGLVTRIGPGPFWFVAILLVFDFGYAGWRLAARKRRERKANGGPFPTYRTIAFFILLLAATSYLVRIVVPIDQYVLFFPTISYLPEYFSFFLIGTLAYRGDWFRKVSSSVAKRVFVVALIATFTLFPLSLSGGHFVGKGYWPSAVYALWDSTFAVGISLSLIVLFRRFFDFSGRLWRFLSQHYYAVYFIHFPIVVTLTAILLSRISIEPLPKFVLIAVIAVPLSWAVAYLLRKIPFADKVL